MSATTIFKGFNIPVEDKSLIVITKDIKEGKYKHEVQHVTQLFKSGKVDEADTAKKLLLAFTPQQLTRAVESLNTLPAIASLLFWISINFHPQTFN